MKKTIFITAAILSFGLVEAATTWTESGRVYKLEVSPAGAKRYRLFTLPAPVVCSAPVVCPAPIQCPVKPPCPRCATGQFGGTEIIPKLPNGCGYAVYDTSTIDPETGNIVCDNFK